MCIWLCLKLISTVNTTGINKEHDAPAAIDAATRAGIDFVLLLFASMVITNRYHRNRLGTTHYAPAAIGAATTAGATFVLLVFASVVITNRSISATKLPASAFFHS